MESRYENNPVTNITWCGAVKFCNWQTEIRGGNTDNVGIRILIQAGSWNLDKPYNENAYRGFRLSRAAD